MPAGCQRPADPWGPLIPAGARARLAVLAQAVPDLSDSFGFECRLTAGAGHAVDLGLALRRASAPALATVADWPAVQRFARRWGDRRSMLHRWVPAVFLEFDVGEAGPVVPVSPSLFITLDWPPREGAARRLEARVAAVAARLVMSPAEARAAGIAMRRVLAPLPPAGRLVHMGIMLGRAAAPVRLSVSLPRRSLSAYLAALGCSPGLITATAWLDDIDPHGTRAHVEFDAGPVVGAGVGVVLGGAPVETSARLTALLAHLRRRGLCTAAAAAALQAWPGETAAASGQPCLRRAVSHVKVVFTPSGAREAKAYLTASP